MKKLTLFKIAIMAYFSATLHCQALDWSDLKGFNIHPNTSDSEISEISALGANIVRLSFDTLPLINKTRPYAINQEALLQLERIIKKCEKEKIYLILDMHTAPGLKGAYTTDGNDELWLNETYQSILITSWGEIAKKYKDYSPYLLAYDILNEPSMSPIYNQGEKGDWNLLANKIVQEIRRIDKSITIILEPAIKVTPSGKRNTSPEALSDLRPIIDKNIVYSPHIYIPLTYTHQGLGSEFFIPRSYPGFFESKYWDKSQLRTALDPIREFQEKNNANIFIGEFSAINTAPGRNLYIQDLISLFKDYGWGWSYHDYSNSNYWSPKPKISKSSDTVLILKQAFAQ